MTGEGFLDLLRPPPRALGEWGVHIPCSNPLSCAAQTTSLHMSTEKGHWEMAALTMATDPASTVMEAKSPWNQRPISDWLPKGDLGLAICPLPCPHPPLTPSHQSPRDYLNVGCWLSWTRFREELLILLLDELGFRLLLLLWIPSGSFLFFLPKKFLKALNLDFFFPRS